MGTSSHLGREPVPMWDAVAWRWRIGQVSDCAGIHFCFLVEKTEFVEIKSFWNFSFLKCLYQLKLGQNESRTGSGSPMWLVRTQLSHHLLPPKVDSISKL